jgi:hypothetical protein
MLQTGLYRLTGITFRSKADGLGIGRNVEEYKDDEEREREEKKHHLYQLKQQLEQYLQ